MRILISFLFLLLFIQAAAAQVIVVELKETITPASDDIIEAALRQAELENSEALIITLNTPGGGFDETKRIIELIETSPVPVIGYVYPKSATAWSAGTLILISTDIAAMAPNTIIGSAQPVGISSEGMEPIEDEKIVNAVVALSEERARLHGRNVTAAREFITKNLNLNAEQAKGVNIIEIISPDIEDLLTQVNGMEIKSKVLDTSGAKIVHYSPSLRLRLMNLLSNPILASLLLLIGIYSLVFGLTSPGFGAEIFGVIAISLGLIGLGFSVNIAAMFLIGLGIALLVFELYTPSFGIIGIAGVACIIIGSVLLVPIGFPGLYSPEFRTTFLVSLISPAVVLAVFFAFAIYKMLKIRKKRLEVWDMIDRTAETIDMITPEATGYVRFEGEYWLARSEERIEPKTKVVIKGKDGRVLIVEPVEKI